MSNPQAISHDLNVFLRAHSDACVSNVEPAAPDGSANVTWQTDEFGHLSAYVASSGGGVDSVFGRTGAVAATTGDYSFSQISGDVNLASQVTGVLPAANVATLNQNTTGTASTITGTIASGKVTGLGTSATVNTGTSGATIPLLSTANTWTSTQTISAELIATVLLTSALPPATATSAGVTGTFVVGVDGFLYICTATNTWVRIQGVTW